MKTRDQELAAWRQAEKTYEFGRTNGICVAIEYAVIASPEIKRKMKRRIQRKARQLFPKHFKERLTEGFWELNSVGARKRLALIRQFIKELQ